MIVVAVATLLRLRRAKPRIPRVERRLLPLACASCLAPEAAFVELLKAPARRSAPAASSSSWPHLACASAAEKPFRANGGLNRRVLA
jgi:hypothetical protein